MDTALTGITVLDLATFVAAPFCCTLLGEFGAEVIKVEQPGRGDDLRRLGTPAREGLSYWWLAEARNKKSITCNLRLPEGQALIKKLVAQVDIVAENFRPGTLERWQLDYETLRAINPGLILVRISAFGQTGPYREQPGFGRIAAAVSGMTYICGYPDRPPVPPGTPTVPDYLAGAFGALGALLALQYRQRTGEGQVVDVGLYEPMLRMLDELIPVYGATGQGRERCGSGTPYVVPHNHYRTADGKWIAIACTNDRMFERLALQAMQQPQLLEAYPTMAVRVQRREEVDALVQQWVGQFSAREALQRLEAAEVPAGLVASVADLFADPHLQARDNLLALPSPLGGVLHMAGIVPKLSRTPGRVEHLGPLTPGAHNEEIYCGRLGLRRDDLDALRARGVI
ncbi:MAG: CoA transferase [Candidatus Tectimicrobiota bacterium]|nr:MAG: CoA transferase [Candidatus Tectomicrobia bacterium]